MAVFYRISKLLAWVADPSAWAVLLVLAAVAVTILNRPRLAPALAGVAALELVAFSSPAFVAAFHGWAVPPAQVTFRPDARYDAAIVLGGDDDRVARGARVVLSGRSRVLLYSGALSLTKAASLVRQLEAAGIPASRIVIERRSRNTRENAVESSRVAALHGWRSLLVITSASHVDRALGCFRRVGLDPDVLPVQDADLPESRGWAPDRAALEESRNALHELIGRVVYRLVGYSV